MISNIDRKIIEIILCAEAGAAYTLTHICIHKESRSSPRSPKISVCMYLSYRVYCLNFTNIQKCFKLKTLTTADDLVSGQALIDSFVSGLKNKREDSGSKLSAR